MENVIRDLQSLSLKDYYDTSETKALREYLVPALGVSTHYCRAVGYFSSAIMTVLAEAFTDFAERGGKMRLVCSPVLSYEDANAFEMLTSKSFSETLNQSINSLEKAENLSDPLDLMAALIQQGSLEIKLAVPNKDTWALFHQKIGYFEDANKNTSAFIGSNNETLRAWASVNSESFEVHNSWQSEYDLKRAENLKNRFEGFWQNNYPGFVFLSIEDGLDFVQKRKTNEKGDISKLKKNVRDWVENRENAQSTDVEVVSEFKLRDYQLEVFENWKNNDYIGVISFATGAGKTITALNCLAEWLSKDDQNGAIVLVPSVRLQKQWLDELIKYRPLHGAQILLVGGMGVTEKWKAGLAGYSSGTVGESRSIVLAVMDSAATSTFVNRVQWKDSLLVVADEMHNLGSLSFKSLLEKITQGGRLGLSATPQRYDEEESLRLRNVFGDDLDPVIDIKRAQDLGVLTEYAYHLNEFKLSLYEAEKFQALDNDVKKYSAIMMSSKEKSKSVKSKLDKARRDRAMVIKKAQSKIPAAEKILREQFKIGDRWLVFLEDSQQLSDFHNTISDLNPYTFHQGMSGDKDATLNAFESLGGIMLVIKMFDEGVDVPSINRAIIVSSSSNPRQYIQRRGRILRVVPGVPKIAKIWDFVAIDSEGYSILESELERARAFFTDALNDIGLISLDALKRSYKGETE